MAETVKITVEYRGAEREYEGEVLTETFETWAVVELFGHRQLAGKVSEQDVAGEKKP